ncbi:hypothetical protein A6769_15640 [Nostoc punctiforme NIES-2108]|uniref:Uncharacterized protein n=1 Tax=Nostoc punctiforme NIES-2108 TaxID=1356359 RepID=A0A367RKZ3_NOSPU|nr:hypothetical protein A6769_15640 [Nostoc punctiforme NIES-2108]
MRKSIFRKHFNSYKASTTRHAIALYYVLCASRREGTFSAASLAQNELSSTSAMSSKMSYPLVPHRPYPHWADAYQINLGDRFDFWLQPGQPVKYEIRIEQTTRSGVTYTSGMKIGFVVDKVTHSPDIQYYSGTTLTNLLRLIKSLISKRQSERGLELSHRKLYLWLLVRRKESRRQHRSSPNRMRKLCLNRQGNRGLQLQCWGNMCICALGEVVALQEMMRRFPLNSSKVTKVR